MAAPHRRRFDHAHPIDDRPGSSRRQRRWTGRPGAAVALGALVIAAAVVAFRPLGAGTAPAVGAPVETGPIAGGPAQSSVATVPSLGPHGDVVPGETQPVISASPEPRSNPPDPRPTAPGELTGYRWPVERARITNGFGEGRPGSFVVDGRTFHDGIDLSSFCGAEIVAAHDGVVLTAGRHHEAFLGWLGDLEPFRARVDRQQGWGGQSITVVIDDRNGYRSIYAHLARTAVKAGAEVQAGDVIGYQGASGHATGCHLHFALFSPLDPRTLELDPKIAAKTKLPAREVMRIDPLLVLPPSEDASIIWGWGARDGP